MKNNWWKILGILLVCYAIIGGFLFDVPRLPILNESIRNLYFHVTIWFAMMFILMTSIYASIKYLSVSNPTSEDDKKLLDSDGMPKNNMHYDILASEAVNVGMLFAAIGIVTGMIWANFTWGAPWVNDPKLNGVAISMLFYFAYIVLRSSIDDEQKRARVSAVYNIFAFVMLIVFIWVLPRLTDSLHPGNGGNPGFGKYDLNSNMRLVFYPAIIGFTIIGYWILNIRVRLKKVNEIILENIANNDQEN